MRKIAAPLVKILVFAVVTVVLTGVLGATIANSQFGDRSGYIARFTDASGLHAGDDVRVFGVKVGQIEEVALTGAGKNRYADVHFTVGTNYRVPASTTATAKFRNIIGQRYLALTTDVGDPANLPPGGLIPPERTQPALNLTVLFNGFKPLFQALDPRQVNQLSAELIAVFQDEGGTIESLLTHTASLTAAIADKDRVIGQVVDNLNSVLGTFSEHAPQLGSLIDTTQQLVSGLAEQRGPIGDSVSALADLTTTTAGLVRDARPALKEDISHLGVLSANLSDAAPMLGELLSKMPGNLQKYIRSLDYGSWYNFFLCNLTGTIGISSLHLTVPILPLPASEIPERCKPS